MARRKKLPISILKVTFLVYENNNLPTTSKTGTPIFTHGLLYQGLAAVPAAYPFPEEKPAPVD
jgi:hypothetical protein